MSASYTKPLSFLQRRALREASARSILDTPFIEPGPSRIASLIEDTKKPCPTTLPTIQPLFDSELYIFMAGLSGAEADELRAKNPPLEPIQVKPRVTKKYDVPDDPDWVRVDLRVTPKGRVKVSMCVPLAPVQEYHRQGHKAPIEVRIVAAKRFGYPDEVLEKMLARHDAWDPKAEAEFLEKIFGVAKKTTSSRPVKVHEVSRVKKAAAKRRHVEFYNLTGLLDYYEEEHLIGKDDINEHHDIVREHLKKNSYQEGDILFLGSVFEEQEKNGFATVIKAKGARSFKIGIHPEDLLVSKKVYYSQAVEAMNSFWNETFGYDIISEKFINELTVNDMYDD